MPSSSTMPSSPHSKPSIPQLTAQLSPEHANYVAIRDSAVPKGLTYIELATRYCSVIRWTWLGNEIASVLLQIAGSIASPVAFVNGADDMIRSHIQTILTLDEPKMLAALPESQLNLVTLDLCRKHNAYNCMAWLNTRQIRRH